MELRITKDWLARHREVDEGHDTSAGSLMLDLAKRHLLDNTYTMPEAVEGSRDEVSEKLKLFPKEQRFRLVTLPWRDDSGAHERSTLAQPYSERNRSIEPAHVADGVEEYRAETGKKREI